MMSTIFDFVKDVRKIEDNMIVYFRASDVCEVFKYKDHREAIKNHVPKRIFREIDFYHEAIYIDLCGVYQLFLNSDIEVLDAIPNI